MLLNQGSNTYDVTNAGAFAGSPQFGLPGCGSGKCSFGGGTFGGAQAGGILDKLFGSGGLSGAGFKQFGSQAGSAAYSSSGSYSGASAGRFRRIPFEEWGSYGFLLQVVLQVPRPEPPLQPRPDHTPTAIKLI